jgi:GNAT superfamily N-acetyltransferase
MIREAGPGDVVHLLRLVRALADYEREPSAVAATADDLRRALFGDRALVHALVAESGGDVVGMAVWYVSFSTWTGRHSLYLEDLYVEEEHRSRGHGRALLVELARRARALGCARMDWSVLDWNEPAQGFYRSLGAAPLPGWSTWRLDGSRLEDLAGGS